MDFFLEIHNGECGLGGHSKMEIKVEFNKGPVDSPHKYPISAIPNTY